VGASSTQLVLPLAFGFGLRHGIDADHLAAVDALTRLNADTPVARHCGSLFALGHGAVVVGIAMLACTFGSSLQAPAWLRTTGMLVALLVLLLLASANLRLALTRSAQPPAPNLMDHLMRRLARAGSPTRMVLIGVLFAASFDTVTHALLFASMAADSVARAALLGGAFAFGMLTADAASGYCVAWLNGHADARANAARRVMCAGAGIASLLVAALVFVRIRFGDRLPDGEAIAIGTSVAVTAIVVVAFAIALLLARSTPRAPAALPGKL